MKTIHFVSLGCPKNRVDTEIMVGVSERSGYRTVGEADGADVIVVNSCGFIDAAKQESIDTILTLSELKHSGSCEKLVVAGCLSQRYPDAMAADMPEVDHFLGSSDMLKLGDVLGGRATDRMLVGNPADYVFRMQDPRRLSASPHSVYLKISEGCSRQCSFCAIPSFRGKQRSRPIDDVVGEARRLVEGGAVELNLISQDTVAYGRDLKDGTDLTALVEALGTVDGLRWLRLFYLYPEKLDDRLIAAMADTRAVVPYVDMPMQHASDAMLKRMRRGHSLDGQRALIERLRARLDGLAIRTAFILGHPGETGDDFEILCDFVREQRFDHVGTFRYSHEDGTHSGTMDDLVDAEVVTGRADTLMDIQRQISAGLLKERIGSDLEVLVDGVSDESEFLIQGRHAGQAPDVDGVVLLVNGTAQPGDFVKARVTETADYDLIADLEAAGTAPRLRVL